MQYVLNYYLLTVGVKNDGSRPDRKGCYPFSVAIRITVKVYKYYKYHLNA